MGALFSRIHTAGSQGGRLQAVAGSAAGLDGISIRDVRKGESTDTPPSPQPLFLHINTPLDEERKWLIMFGIVHTCGRIELLLIMKLFVFVLIGGKLHKQHMEIICHT